MEIISHQGMSLVSLGRGIMGMLVLILIAYTLSNNRKNISWKVVGLGLLTQLVIAIGVIKIAWIKSFFEYISGFLSRF
jgi:CNT family concentrative nucleoside transporter